MRIRNYYHALKTSARSTYLVLLLSAVIIGLLSVVMTGCSPSTEIGSELPYHVTPATALDPEPDEEMLRHLLDSSTIDISAAMQRKGASTASLEDSITTLLTLAQGMVTAGTSRIKYVWGGKFIDKPTEWANPPASNATGCVARVGLDCSGFIQHIFEKAGFGRHDQVLNAASLSSPFNWDKVTKRGYTVLSIPTPQISELLPGDILFFGAGPDHIVHTGVFWSHSARTSTGSGPAMIHSVGRARCDSSLAREARGVITGVSAGPLGPYWQSQLVSAIRIIGRTYLEFGADGQTYFAKEDRVVGSIDTLLKSIIISGWEQEIPPDDHAKLIIAFEGVAPEPGRYLVRPVSLDFGGTISFYSPRTEGAANDSMLFYASPPPNWWKGTGAPSTGGEMQILGISLGENGDGAIAGTFNVKMNSYFTRFIDSTYVIDSVKYTKQVQKYYYLSKEVKGKFSGPIWH